MRHRDSVLLGVLAAPPAMLAFATAFGATISAADYHYPYRDPYVATSTVALLGGRERISSGEIHDLRLTVIPGRSGLPFLHGKGRLRYRLYQHHGPAPLIFVIPGIGSSAYAGSARFMAELLADHGFHAVVLPCPFSWNFALAASSSGYPGLTGADAADLYYTMQLVLADVKRRYAIHIQSLGMVGMSDGALYAGYVSKLDREQGKLGLKRTLLVNPPVNVLAAIDSIDRMVKRGQPPTKLKRQLLEGRAETVVERARRGDPFQPKHYARWGQRLGLDDKALGYLIGIEIRRYVGDTAYAVDLLHHLQVLTAPISYGYRSARLDEAQSDSIMSYVKDFLLPYLRKKTDRPWSLEALDAQTSLRAIGDSLRTNPSVFLMHNLDDPLVSPSGMAFLRSVFGERATFYRLGGHLGNLWYPANRRAMLAVFSGLKQHQAPSSCAAETRTALSRGDGFGSSPFPRSHGSAPGSPPSSGSPWPASSSGG
jgi:hypothetical protein